MSVNCIHHVSHTRRSESMSVIVFGQPSMGPRLCPGLAWLLLPPMYV